MLEIFTTAAAIQGFFLAIVLIKNKRGNNRANAFLAMLLVIFSMVIFHSLYVPGYFEQTMGYKIKMNEPFILLIGPFIYFYVRELISEKFSFSIKDTVHFIPFALFPVISILAITGDKNSELLKFIDKNEIIIGIASWVITFVLLIIYIKKIIDLSGIHEKKIEDEFSTIEEIGLQWIKKLLIVFLIVLIVLVTGFFIIFFHNDNIHFRKLIVLISALIIYVMGYRGLRQPDIFNMITLKSKIKSTELEAENLQYTSETTEKEGLSSDTLTEFSAQKTTKEKYKNSALSDEDIKIIEGKITRFMEKEKPYLNPDFNMEMLSEAIGVNKNYVSQVINSRFGYNYFNYVNYYRVEEVKRRIMSPENEAYTILAVAFDSGFNSKASFNSIFKKFTGITPSEYKNTQI